MLRFYVVNPTNVGYDFSWEGQGNAHPSWRCVTQRGMILAGKRGEMVFEFTPDDMEIAEVYRWPVFVFFVLYLFFFLLFSVLFFFFGIFRTTESYLFRDVHWFLIDTH